MSDSSHIVAYCMTAEMTLANRRPSPEPGNDTRLVSIDVTTGRSSDIAAGPGVKMNPSPLAGNDIGYIRKDTAEAGIYYTSGRRGPRARSVRHHGRPMAAGSSLTNVRARRADDAGQNNSAAIRITS